MILSDDQVNWAGKLTRSAKSQAVVDVRDAKKAAILENFSQQREQNWSVIQEGMAIKVAKVNEKGKVKTQDVSRKDMDATKSFDVAEQREGFRVATRDGKAIEGELTDEWAEGQELIEQPEFAKFSKAQHLIIQMMDEAMNAEEEKLDSKGKPIKKNGKVVKKPLFTKEELTAEIYDPLVRRGVPETFVPNGYSRTQAMIEGSFEEYSKRLQKEKIKGFVEENKDLGIALFRMAIAVPGNVMAAKGATDLLASQQETTGTPDPVHVFQQNFGLVKNDSTEGTGMGELADNLQKAAQSWAFIQNASDIAFDGVRETVNTVGELNEMNKESGEEEESDPERAKIAPALAQSLISAMALNVGNALAEIGPGASTIYGTLIKRSLMAGLLAKKDVNPNDVTAVIRLLDLAVYETLKRLLPDAASDDVIKKASKRASSALDKSLNVPDVLKALKAAKFEAVVSTFTAAAQKAGKALATTELKQFVTQNKAAMQQKASDFVSDELADATAESAKGLDNDAEHKKEKGHDPDWTTAEDGKAVCLRCEADLGDVDLFAGLLERKIVRLKKDDAYFKLAVNFGGLGFDIAANFLAPMAMGGALLRMSKFIFAAVKRWIDFSNFCDSKTAMMNAASAYSPAVRRFREDSRNQGAHYTINAACEGVKIIAACLQCTPAVIGGIVAANVATGIEATEAALYEMAKRYQLEQAWSTYKKALRNPDNRKLALIAMRENPTLAKYAMAWGAVIEKDPLVGDFMAYCDLDSDTLRGTAKIDKVVEYLEARMPDDITVVGREVEGAVTDWAPTTVQLTADSWIDAKTRGETQGDVRPVDTPAIESALLKVEAAGNAIIAAKAKSAKTREVKVGSYLERVDELKKALAGYNPKNTKGEHHEDMWQVARQFSAKADIEIAAKGKELEAIKKERAPKANSAKKAKTAK